MKSLFLTLLCPLFIFITSEIDAQDKIDIGFKFGVLNDNPNKHTNRSAFYTSFPHFQSYYSGGFQYGVSFRKKIAENWSFNAEVTHTLRTFVVEIQNVSSYSWSGKKHNFFEIPIKLNFVKPFKNDQSYSYHIFGGGFVGWAPNISFGGGGYGGTTLQEFEESNTFHYTTIKTQHPAFGGVFGIGLEKKFANNGSLYVGMSYNMDASWTAFKEQTEYEIGSNSYNVERYFSAEKMTFEIIFYNIPWSNLKNIRAKRKAAKEDYWNE